MEHQIGRELAQHDAEQGPQVLAAEAHAERANDGAVEQLGGTELGEEVAAGPSHLPWAVSAAPGPRGVGVPNPVPQDEDSAESGRFAQRRRERGHDPAPGERERRPVPADGRCGCDDLREPVATDPLQPPIAVLGQLAEEAALPHSPAAPVRPRQRGRPDRLHRSPDRWRVTGELELEDPRTDLDQIARMKHPLRGDRLAVDEGAMGARVHHHVPRRHPYHARVLPRDVVLRQHDPALGRPPDDEGKDPDRVHAAAQAADQAAVRTRRLRHTTVRRVVKQGRHSALAFRRPGRLSNADGDQQPRGHRGRGGRGDMPTCPHRASRPRLRPNIPDGALSRVRTARYR